jgi:hypothetical protein
MIFVQPGFINRFGIVLTLDQMSLVQIAILQNARFYKNLENGCGLTHHHQ